MAWTVVDAISVDWHLKRRSRAVMDLKELTDARSPVPPTGVPRLPNIHALTSVRFFAALHVALFHMVQVGPLQKVMRVGYLGVSFFFVLSGFILTYSHAGEYEGGKGNTVRFWVARLARLYPLYLLSMVLAAYVHRAQFHPASHILIFGSDLLMIQAWSVHTVRFFNVPAWSLSCEAFFYLVFPFVFLKMRPSTLTKAVLWVSGMWALAMASPLIFALHYPGVYLFDNGPSAMGMNYRNVIDKNPLASLPEFLAGISLGWLYLRFRPGPRTLSCLAAGGALALIVILPLAGYVPYALPTQGPLIPLYAMLILGLCGRNWLSRLLENKVMVLLGEASFAFYLLHLLFNEWVTTAFGAASDIWAALWKLAILIPVSVLLHIFVERPGRKMILQYWKQRSSTPQTLSTAR